MLRFDSYSRARGPAYLSCGVSEKTEDSEKAADNYGLHESRRQAQHIREQRKGRRQLRLT